MTVRQSLMTRVAAGCTFLSSGAPSKQWGRCSLFGGSFQGAPLPSLHVRSRRAETSIHHSGRESGEVVLTRTPHRHSREAGTFKRLERREKRGVPDGVDNGIYAQSLKGLDSQILTILSTSFLQNIFTNDSTYHQPCYRPLSDFDLPALFFCVFLFCLLV